MGMWISALFFCFSLVHAEDLSMDEKRLRDFKAYVLKKEDYERERQERGQTERAKRQRREAAYESARASFVRPVVTEPPGRESYERKMAELEKRYQAVRERYSARQNRLAEALHEKIDRTKMVEYDIKSNKEAQEE